VVAIHQDVSHATSGTQLGPALAAATCCRRRNGPQPIDFGGLIPKVITAPGDAKSIPLFSNLGATGRTSGIEFTSATNGFRLIHFTMARAAAC